MTVSMRLLTVFLLMAGLWSGAATAARADEKKADGDKVLGKGKTQAGLVVEVTDVKRTSDTFLTIKFRFTNPTKEKVTQKLGFMGDTLYYVEAGGKFKYSVKKDEKGKRLISSYSNSASAFARDAALTLEPGKTYDCWAKFSQPGKEVKMITLYVPGTEPIEDIPLPPAKE